MNALEELEKEYLAKKAKIEKQMVIASLLPTNDKIITWIGEDGWDKEGKPKPPVEKTCSLLPYLFHDPTAYKVAQHIAYKAPDGMKWNNGQGESTSSKYRDAFVKQYVLAVIDAFRPFVIQTVAVKGKRYTGHFPTKFDFTKIRDYEDAKELNYGDCEIYTTAGRGEHSFISGTFSFYVDIEGIGLMKVDVETPGMFKLAPVAHGVSQYGGNGPVSSVQSWSSPTTLRKPTNIFSYGGGDNSNRSHSYKYLFNTMDDALVSLGVMSNDP